MKLFKYTVFFLLLISFIFLFAFKKETFAQACQDIGNVNERIECYQKELSRLSSQTKTLSNQIAQFDAQIRLATLKIAQTEEKISLLSGRIDRLEVSLDVLAKAFSSRAVETYKMVRYEDPMLVLISSPDLGEAVSRFFYLKRIQDADRDLLTKLQKTQTDYKDEKTDQEELQNELEKQKADLNKQKSSKNMLLSQTKNDEKQYQQLLAQAYAEKAALEAALISGIKVGPVKRGDPIALVGNTGYPGCSTGKHLHFELRRNNSWFDPLTQLQSKSIKNEQNGGDMMTVGNGGWPWPIEDTVRITQFYGNTPYSWRYAYSGGIHTGIDMVSTSSDVIRASEDGQMYKSSQLCGGSSVINIVYIEHNDGLISFYLHVQ
jgi:septal ring factor EnvC (AmiA/AmiB activator)